MPIKRTPRPLAPAAPITFPRADPAELARFDPSTKLCIMNCGPSTNDPRSRAERKFLCGECHVVAPPLPLAERLAELAGREAAPDRPRDFRLAPAEAREILAALEHPPAPEPGAPILRRALAALLQAYVYDLHGAAACDCDPSVGIHTCTVCDARAALAEPPCTPPSSD